MKLKDLADAIQVLHKNNLDDVDALVLNEIGLLIKEKDSATIMKIVESSAAASPATVHARIKKLCDQNMLKKVTPSDNLRYKVLEFGNAYDKFLTQLKDA